MISGTVGSDDRCILVAIDSLRHSRSGCGARWARCKGKALTSCFFHDELARVRDDD